MHEIKCSKCHKWGHTQRECRTTNTFRGRGYSRHSYKNESEKRIAGTSTREDEGGSNSFNTRVMSSTVNLPMEDQPPAKENMKWLLDSGCSDHIVNTD